MSFVSRREFLYGSALGLGGLALTALLKNNFNTPTPFNPHQGHLTTLHHPAKVKHVIHLCMSGGPSQMETFDNKPVLKKYHDTSIPEDYLKKNPLPRLQKEAKTGYKCMGPQFEFKKYGQSGIEVASIFPHVANIVDDLCVIRSMQSDQIDHGPALTFFNTGTILPNRPSMGSWVNYALGSDCDNLPGFVVLSSAGGGMNQPVSSNIWHSGFLPSTNQGVKFQSAASKNLVPYIQSPKGVTQELQTELYKAINEINHESYKHYKDEEIQTRIHQNEMAAKMQLSVPELSDLSKEPDHIQQLYGPGEYAKNCLMARRLVERGVRFIQLYHRGWDHHEKLKLGLKRVSHLTDQATAALITDLKQRGLLKDTLVIWGGEFGRTPVAQNGDGREHHIKAFSMWLAGGGIKPGMVHGVTDELGFFVKENPVHVRDLHALILHLLGIDHTRLTYTFQGVKQKLTGFEKAQVPKSLLI